MVPLPAIELPEEDVADPEPLTVLPEDVSEPVVTMFLAVVTALPAVRNAATGSPQEPREITSADRADHWMKRFM